MLKLVSADLIDEDDELVPPVALRVDPEGAGTALFFFFSVADDSRGVV